MFSHILVPTDFHQANSSIFKTVADMAVQNKAKVTLLHVVEPIKHLSEDENRSFYERLLKRSQEALAREQTELEKFGVSAHGEILMGRRPTTIVTYAQEQDIDLIMMRSSKLDLSGPPSGFAGISHQVAIVAQCPVMLVK